VLSEASFASFKLEGKLQLSILKLNMENKTFPPKVRQALLTATYAGALRRTLGTGDFIRYG